MIKKIFNVLASCFGIGYTPKIPGTAASVATAFLLFFRPDISLLSDVIIVLLLIPISIFICHYADKYDTGHDAGWIVLDEFVGMYIALIGLPRIWWIYLISLILFRFFDIKKPFLIGMVERRFANGLGIVLDDVVAGVFTFFILFILKFLVL